MSGNVYLLTTDPKDVCRDVIHSRDTNLKIRVHCLGEGYFDLNDGEIQLYGYAGKQLYAFETIDIKAEDALDVLNAIKWYAMYINYPEMEILPDDPRTDKTVAV